jgi:aminoglycoside phosphotransferase (APT) family kinase protein
VKFDLNTYDLFQGEILEEFYLLQEQGYCNENYCLKTDKKKYLVRKFKVQEPDRKLEYNVQKMAYQRDFAPQPFLLDEEKGLMICEYIDGVHRQKLRGRELKQLATVLQSLHRIRSHTRPLNLKRSFSSIPKDVKKALELLQKYKTDNVVCHNDLNPKNILFSDRKVILIDWEYAGMNDRYFDLASISIEFKLNRQEEKLFLQGYFGKNRKIKWRKLKAYKVIYETLCKQWFEAFHQSNR